MRKQARYKGFNTSDKTRPTYSEYDVELIKRDILNHFETRPGERVNRPEFGTRIYEYLMDPHDTITKELINDDVMRVIASEPRVSLIESHVVDREHAVIIKIVLKYLDFDLSEEMYIEFSKETE
jgi:phage baseplate assembly protein W